MTWHITDRRQFMIRMLTGLALVLALGVGAAAAQESAPRPVAQGTAAIVLNLNTATASQLEGLPGIGKATADRIVEYRQKGGGFKKVEELMNIRGIGEKSFLKLKPLVTVSAPKAQGAP
jgi:competence protein ComEA